MGNVIREALDYTALIALLSESYAESYRDSSLKVRRRYRRLIAALTKVKEQEVAAEVSSRKRVIDSDGGG